MELATRIGYGKHFLLLCFPAQGHINPCLHLARRLISLGSTVTLASTSRILQDLQDCDQKLSIAHLPEPYAQGISRDRARDFIASDQTDFLNAADGIVKNLIHSNSRPSCIIFDPFFHWALDLGERFGIPCACQWMSCLGSALIDRDIRRLVAEIEKYGEESEFIVPGLPVLRLPDLPHYLQDKEEREACPLLKFMPELMVNTKWILVNNVEELDKPLLEQMPNAIAIGPVFPVFEKSEGLRPAMLKEDSSCLEWLDTRAPDSVLYVSFGSVAQLAVEQVKELVQGLEASRQPFLWVLRPGLVEESAQKFLDEFVIRTKEQGMVISWAPQLEVLKHFAVGGFLSHCGWNSTFESICLGVPIMGWPQFGEQIVNSKMIADVWKNGVRIKKGEDGIVRKEDIVKLILRLMSGEEAKEFRRRAKEMSDVAKRALMPDGSSSKNLEAFILALGS